MEKVYSANPKVEVAGSAAKSMVDNLITPDIEHLVRKHHLDDIQLDSWVPLSNLCNLFNDVAGTMGGGATQAFVAMGMKIAEQSEFPPEMLQNLTMPIMMMGWDDHYKANHRGATLPAIQTVQISDTVYELHMPGEEHPYPYDMTYGMAYGFCRRLLSRRELNNFVVEYDKDHSPQSDWTEGVILRVKW